MALGCAPDGGVRGITVDGRLFHVNVALSEVGLYDGVVVRAGLDSEVMRSGV